MSLNSQMTMTGNGPQPEDKIVWYGVLAEGADLFVKNLYFFVGFGMAIGLAEVLPKIAGPQLSAISFLMSIFASAAAVCLLGILISAVNGRVSKPHFSFNEALAKTKDRFWIFFLSVLLYYLIFAVGLLLLIVPGIYWGIIYVFVPFMAVLEKEKNNNFFVLSESLVKGCFGRVLLIGTILIVVNVLVDSISKFDSTGMINIILTVFLLPLQTCVLVVLYHRLKHRMERRIAAGKSAMKIIGEFRNEQGEISSRWFQVADREELDAYLQKVGLQTMRIHSLQYIDLTQSQGS